MLVRFWRQSLWGKLIIVAAAFLILLWIMQGSVSLPFSERQPLPKDEHGENKISDAAATHTCVIEPFTQQVKKGDSAMYTLKLLPSRNGKSYDLVMGDLPEKTGGRFDASSGRAPKDVLLTIDTGSESQDGSFNIVVVYREYQGLLAQPLLNYCQFNLIIQ